MELLARHVVLTEGESLEACRTHVMNFFERTSLVRYDNIVVEDQVMGSDAEFVDALDSGLEKNKRTLGKFIDELGATGFAKRNDLMELKQGYHSKILHIIAHFLDGFVGIDSVFYNLVEDSHWLSDETKEQISQEPDRFRLLFLKCYSLTPREAALLHM
ncbi:MAG: hypothetical protein ACR2PB_03945 [Desulfocapsaceae bacterium]